MIKGMRVHPRASRGQITLPFVLLISGIIVEVAIAGSFVTYFLSTSGYGDRLAERASVAANSGIRDAMQRITNNKEFSSAPCDSPYSYSISMENDSATVAVCRVTDVSSNKYVYTISSVGTAVSRQKKLVATFLADKTSGRVYLESTTEQALQ